MSSPKTQNSPCAFAHTHVHTHTNAGQSAWHQTVVHGQMRCVRAPCCQEADRKKKQTLSNGDMTCSPGRKLKQTINGPWSLQYSSKIPTAAPLPSLCSPVLALSHVGRGALTFQDPGPCPGATYFCHPFTPVLLSVDNMPPKSNWKNLVPGDSPIQTDGLLHTHPPSSICCYADTKERSKAIYRPNFICWFMWLLQGGRETDRLCHYLGKTSVWWLRPLVKSSAAPERRWRPRCGDAQSNETTRPGNR